MPGQPVNTGELERVPPGGGYGNNFIPFDGYKRYANGDDRSFLMQRFAHLRALHMSRLYAHQKSLDLWASMESEIYGDTKKRDDEVRPRSSKPSRIVDMYTGLVWSKEPQMQVAALRPAPFYTKTAGDLESDVITMMRAWKIWRAWERGVWWAQAVGVGFIEYWYNQLAMDDEPLMCAVDVDPRHVFFKESKANNGKMDYVFIVRDEQLGELRERYPDGLGNFNLDNEAMTNPTRRIKVYTYWSIERARDPMSGRPIRAVVQAVFTDYGWLRAPEVMVGYTQIPVVMVRGSDIPLEHEDKAAAYQSVLEPVRDELKEEIKMLAALLTNAKYHMNPAYNLYSNRGDIKSRVRPERGGANHLFLDEKVEAMRKAESLTPDVQTILQSLGEGIDGSTVPKQFQGNMKLDDISGIALSVGSTGPLIRMARRQQLVEDALELFIGPFLSCLARHAMTEGRTITAVGPSPKDLGQFHMAVLQQNDIMQLDGDVRVIAKLSSSLPRDAINEIMTLAGLARDGHISKYTVTQQALRAFDLGHTNAHEEQQRIYSEKLEAMQFEFESGRGPGSKPTAVENDYVPAGYEQMADGSLQADPFHQPGPHEPLLQGPMAERRPGPRMGPAVHDQLTGRGADPTSNPLLHGRRARQSLDNFGAMMNLQPRRRG